MKAFILTILGLVMTLPCVAQSVTADPTPIKPVKGYYNLVWGSNTATKTLTGSYNFCLGFGSCPNLSSESCVFDVVEPTPQDITTSADAHVGTMTYAIALAKFQDEKCKDGKERGNAAYNWFSKIIVMQVQIQQDNLKDTEKQ